MADDMPPSDTSAPRAELEDIRAALGLLTRLPLSLDPAHGPRRGARAAWAFPLAGVVVALPVGLLAVILSGLGLAPVMVAGVILAASAALTGAMHEDGLADSLDGLWGGWDRARRLEIMKDSRIGTYGVLGLVLSLLLRWSALTMIVATGGLFWVLIGVAAASRAAMVGVMATLPHAREDGLSRDVGRPDDRTTGIALAIGVVLGLLTLGFWPVVWAALVVVAWGAIARARIGGQTGDILGATQQLAEVVLLMVVASALA